MKLKVGDYVRLLEDCYSEHAVGYINRFVSDEEARELDGRDPDEEDGIKPHIEVYFGDDEVDLFYPDDLDKINEKEYIEHIRQTNEQ